MSSFKSKKPKPPKLSLLEPKTKPPHVPDEFVFSFKYIDLDSNKKFQTEKTEKGYVHSLLSRLHDLSKMKLFELTDPKKADQLHFHSIDWKTTTVPSGFQKVPSELLYGNAYQFYITKNKHGRIHGFIIGNVFFVVWIDPQHLLYK